MRFGIAAIAACVASASALCAPAFAADVNRFNTAAEIGDWRYDFGGPTQTKTFSTDDATGSPTSGSMRLDMTFGANGGASYAYTNDEYGTATNLSGQRLEFDIKIDPASATDAFGNNGYFQFVVRNTDGYAFNTVVGENLNDADGWRHISVILGAESNAVRAYTFQLFGGGGQNIQGSVGMLIDNITVNPVPEPTTLAAVAGASILMRRRRR